MAPALLAPTVRSPTAAAATTGPGGSLIGYGELGKVFFVERSPCPPGLPTLVFLGRLNAAADIVRGVEAPPGELLLRELVDLVYGELMLKPLGYSGGVR